ncbi:Metal tolerance protein C2 [Dichanthelium oligosanthes]|uniref:Metal tolerance protein C2 n=1 Tax=Dichanthelium oligosanthes TaxID=888268 RepID=A0A1E5V9H7_9POAL|nr:Metal tolerance protein C2 [Dichanthelium oligosanthes]
MDPSQMMFPMWGPPPPAAVPPPSDDPATAPNAQPPFLPPPNRGWKRKNPAAAYQPPALGDLQVQNRAKARRWFKNSSNPNPNNTRKYFFPKNKNKAAAPRNTTSFIIRAKRAGGIASLVSPCPVTPAVLPTPRLSPSREGLADMAQAQWGVDGYGSMKGLIRLRSSPQPANPNAAAAASDDDDEGNSSGSDVEEHVEVERRLDHDLSRFEMVYPGRGEDVGGYLFEDDDDYDQDAHVARLEEENLTLKERLFLMEQEVGDMRRRLEALEARFSLCEGIGGGKNPVEEAPPGNDAARVHAGSENSSEGNAQRVHVGSEKNGGEIAAKQSAVASEKTGEQGAVGGLETTGEHNIEMVDPASEKKTGEENGEENRIGLRSPVTLFSSGDPAIAGVSSHWMQQLSSSEVRGLVGLVGYLLGSGGPHGEPSRSRLPHPRPAAAAAMDTATAKAAWNANYGVVSSGDRRLAFSRQLSSNATATATTPRLARSDSSIAMPMPPPYQGPKPGKKLLRLATASRPMRRLALLLSLNVAYSATELAIGLFTGRVGLVSDAFHLTFGCGLLTFSLFAMAASRTKPDNLYTYGYKRLEVLAAFTNAVFLLFLSFSLAVEALHAFMQDESEHKHYLIVSAVTNLLVNLLGVWFFRSYARVNIVYRNAEDMNYHSVCLHVLADSIRSAGLILASWFLSLGIENAEVLCLGIVSVAVFMLVLPLFKATGNILLQIAPGNVPPSAFTKCFRQITACEDVSEVWQCRFWELVPGQAVGSLSIRVKSGTDDRAVLEYAHGLYQDLGIQDLTIQTDES